MSSIIIGIISLILVFNILYVLYTNHRNFNFIIRVYRGFSLYKLIETTILIAVVLLSYVLIVYYIPLLNWGWFNLINSNGVGVNGAVLIASEDINSSYTDVFMGVFLILFIFAVPFLAKLEEDFFRKGHNSFKEIVVWSFIFGFVYLLLGIPIALGFSLTILGLFFGYKYYVSYTRFEKEYIQDVAEEMASMHSTTYHTLYNTELMLLLIISIIL